MTEELEKRRYNDVMQLLAARRRTLKLAAEYHLASAAEATLEAEMIDADMRRGRALERSAREFDPARMKRSAATGDD